MANKSYQNLLDELDDREGDSQPYDSIAARDPLEDLSLSGRASAMADTSGSNVTPSARDAVKKSIAAKMAPQSSEDDDDDEEDSLPASAAAPMTAAGGIDYRNDPLMKDFAARDNDLQALRAAKLGADQSANTLQALQTIAQGANAPTPSPLPQSLGKQNEEVMDSALKDQGLRQKVMTAIEARQMRKETADSNQSIRRLALQDAAARRQDAADAKDDANIDKWSKNLKDDLDPNKARGGNMAKNQARSDNADRVQALLAQVHNNPDPRQMEELAISTQSLLSATGTPGAEQVKALIPRSAWGSAKALSEWLMNEPMGTDQQKFVERMADTVQREKDVAQGQVQKAQSQRLAAHSALKEADPDTYAAILHSYGFDENGKPEKQDKDQPGSGYAQDVIDYAHKHNIGLDQAQAIKNKRTM